MMKLSHGSSLSWGTSNRLQAAGFADIDSTGTNASDQRDAAEMMRFGNITART
ncbi:hypothetical protein [Gimesia chilikensis]|uniref:hypothetical protein n=1 Tax=Gimesia chilikensis TaxID=2605989 RepID=UPI00165978D9|nr:hypothetical protein [Gimesia chilikensis]